MRFVVLQELGQLLDDRKWACYVRFWFCWVFFVAGCRWGGWESWGASVPSELRPVYWNVSGYGSEKAFLKTSFLESLRLVACSGVRLD